jgi:hypothetical protein
MSMISHGIVRIYRKPGSVPPDKLADQSGLLAVPAKRPLVNLGSQNA